MADDSDGVGPLFDWLGNGDVAWSFPGADYEVRTTQASADFMPSHTPTWRWWSSDGGCST